MRAAILVILAVGLGLGIAGVEAHRASVLSETLAWKQKLDMAGLHGASPQQVASYLRHEHLRFQVVSCPQPYGCTYLVPLSPVPTLSWRHGLSNGPRNLCFSFYRGRLFGWGVGYPSDTV